jgi:hypothetical protein
MLAVVVPSWRMINTDWQVAIFKQRSYRFPEKLAPELGWFLMLTSFIYSAVVAWSDTFTIASGAFKVSQIANAQALACADGAGGATRRDRECKHRHRACPQAPWRILHRHRPRREQRLALRCTLRPS